jgi:dienelactone hydrolase
VLLQVGALDAYDPAGAPEALRDEVEKIAPGLITLVVHADATHAFDRSAEPDMVVADPFAHGGRGGEVLFAANPAAAAAARQEAAKFFAKVFGLL